MNGYAKWRYSHYKKSDGQPERSSSAQFDTLNCPTRTDNLGGKSTAIQQYKAHDLSRRAFFGVSCVALCTLLLGTKSAWAGVGDGVWGNAGGVAQPGSHFGCDGGWGYSNSGKVWLAVSCNATVGRMTELFLEISVTSFYANGGYWHPTWITDYADTHVDSFIRRDGGGEWLSSVSGFYDTEYDNSNFHGPYTTDVLRVAREPGDWWAWAGVRAWCDSPDNAYGINTTAEASQLIPHHVLVNDGAWRGKIVTLTPQANAQIRLTVEGGGVANDSNVVGTKVSDFTHQHWIALKSAQGRTCLVSVHSGDAARLLYSYGEDWYDLANIVVHEQNSSPAESVYLHNLGNGYHLIIFECSGCALDLYDGNVVQINCLNNWTSPSQLWHLEEPLFQTRPETTVNITGDAQPGGILTVDSPSQCCIPLNYPNTSGMRYLYTWYRGSYEGACTEQVQQIFDNATRNVVEKDAHKYLTCVITARTRYANIAYRGEVVSSSVYVNPSKFRVAYFADDESTPCYTDEAVRDQLYCVPSQANAAAEKPECAGLECWYCDNTCTIPYVDTLLTEDTSLYARNRVELIHAMAEPSCLIQCPHEYFTDQDCTHPLIDNASLLPAMSEHYYNQLVFFTAGKSVWYKDMGTTREAACAPGAYADASASGPLMRAARLTKNTTVYLLWQTPTYDGIAVS